MAELVGWDVTLTIRGPILTTSSAPLEFGIDAPFARNAAGEYYIAGTLVKGRLKDAWRELHDTGLGDWDWQTLIGREPKKDDPDWTSERGALQFTDFVYSGSNLDEKSEEKIIYRIECDDATGAVSRGQNLMIQTPFQAGGNFPFKGRVWAIVSEKVAKELDTSLSQGLCWIPGVGADTTVGFGVVSGIAVSRAHDIAHGEGLENPPAGDIWALAFRPNGPLCVGGKRIAENIFESEAEIPGGVLKGAIADAILRIHDSKARDVSELSNLSTCTMKELCAEFSDLRFLHAKPAKIVPRKRPSAIPASTARIGSLATLKDVALATALPNFPAPEFSIDWKYYDDAEELFGITHVPRELRVRTKIKSDVRRAEDGALFAYRMVVQRALAASGNIEEYEWLTEVSFSQIGDDERRAKAKAQLADLLSRFGIPGVGKLKTHCATSCVKDTLAAASAKTEKKSKATTWVITLQTPALLCEVQMISAGLSDATAAYEAYWSEVSKSEGSESKLTLVRHFAQQTLVGGEFLWKQYSSKKSYSPLVLTDSGAVFVLEATKNADVTQIEKLIGVWESEGLPVAKAVRTKLNMAGNANDWDKCPYIPQNGYGEIAVDLDWHWKEALD
jgi:hypothetical protein